MANSPSIPPAAKSWIGWLGAVGTVIGLALAMRTCDADSVKAARSTVQAHDDSESAHSGLRLQVQANEAQLSDHEVRLRAIERRDEVLNEILRTVRGLRGDADDR